LNDSGLYDASVMPRDGFEVQQKGDIPEMGLSNKHLCKAMGTKLSSGRYFGNAPASPEGAEIFYICYLLN
jgi:hypothetical protein